MRSLMEEFNADLRAGHTVTVWPNIPIEAGEAKAARESAQPEGSAASGDLYRARG
jgi:hypothetical protein